MVTVPVNIQLIIAALLFLIGLIGLMVRRNLVFMLMCTEIMLNSAGLAFIIAASHWAQTDGQIMFIFILAVAATEVSVGLALILQMHHHFKTLDVDALDKLKEDNDL
jgi:NADH-quinone oxidoreductase subunit K